MNIFLNVAWNEKKPRLEFMYDCIETRADQLYRESMLSAEINHSTSRWMKLIFLNSAKIMTKWWLVLYQANFHMPLLLRQFNFYFTFRHFNLIRVPFKSFFARALITIYDGIFFIAANNHQLITIARRRHFCASPHLQFMAKHGKHFKIYNPMRIRLLYIDSNRIVKLKFH